MKSKFGVFLIVLGAALIIGALSLFAYNQNEDNAAGEAVAEVMPQLLEKIQENQQEQARQEAENPGSTKTPVLNVPVELLTPEDKAMTEVEINGDSYVGYVLIPSVSLEMPVMSEWSYPNLKKSPCRYFGTVKGENLVIIGHNFIKHFRPLHSVEVGAEVYFVDMDGVTTEYSVVATDILSPYAVEDMVSGEYDLTLYTCTYGGANRLFVRCDMVE